MEALSNLLIEVVAQSSPLSKNLEENTIGQRSIFLRIDQLTISEKENSTFWRIDRLAISQSAWHCYLAPMLFCSLFLNQFT